jgi:hypothetical protein
MPDNIDKYLSNAGIDNGRIAQRFRKTLEAIYNFLNVKGITRNIIVEHLMLKTAIFDFYVDIARLKEYHGMDRVNFEKIYGYMAYWILKRKPLRFTTPFKGCEFINELFVTSYLISNILSEKHMDGEKCGNNMAFNNFQSLLYYNLKYRPVTQQSLELMIEAFFCSCDF